MIKLGFQSLAIGIHRLVCIAKHLYGMEETTASRLYRSNTGIDLPSFSGWTENEH